MTRNALSAFVVFVVALAVDASAALSASASDPAKASDPTKVGENAKGLVEPNAKAIWWICLVCGLIYAGASQKRGRGASIIFGLAIAGVVIYNPSGVGTFMNGVADGVLPG